MNRARTLINLGGSPAISDRNKSAVNAVLHSTKTKGASYLLHYEALRWTCLGVESTLKKMGLPQAYWDGVEFSTYSRGPGARYNFDTVVGVWALVRREGGQWLLVDAAKSSIGKTEDGHPRFRPFSPEQWEQMPDPGDNPYNRVNIDYMK